MEKIRITKKDHKRGADEYKVVSVRMHNELLEKIDGLSARSNRSRNQLINLLLEAAVEAAIIEDACDLD